jgi:hypothetical protein
MTAALELVAGVLLAAGAVLFVLRPILQPAWAAAQEAAAAAVDDDDFEDVSPTAVALRALKEIEFDRATGKLSDADYQTLKDEYTAEAVAAMRETGDVKRETGDAVAPLVSSPVSRLPSPACPAHGPRPEGDAEFCSVCGRRLQSAAGFCARCGTSLESDAHFCHRCGSRVAA